MTATLNWGDLCFCLCTCACVCVFARAVRICGYRIHCHKRRKQFDVCYTCVGSWDGDNHDTPHITKFKCKENTAIKRCMKTCKNHIETTAINKYIFDSLLKNSGWHTHTHTQCARMCNAEMIAAIQPARCNVTYRKIWMWYMRMMFMFYTWMARIMVTVTRSTAYVCQSKAYTK